MFIEMKNAARALDFEKAAELRDEIQKIQAMEGKVKKRRKV
jgi:excinuclease UvrABC nuclease subunit